MGTWFFGLTRTGEPENPGGFSPVQPGIFRLKTSGFVGSVFRGSTVKYAGDSRRLPRFSPVPVERENRVPKYFFLQQKFCFLTSNFKI